MKTNINTVRSLHEIMSRGGAVMSSDWVNGSGNYVSKRTIPVHCVEIAANSISGLRGIVKKTALKIAKDHPRVQRLIIVDDVRAVNALIKSRADEI